LYLNEEDVDMLKHWGKRAASGPGLSFKSLTDAVSF
jgi:hypothetical protein